MTGAVGTWASWLGPLASKSHLLRLARNFLACDEKFLTWRGRIAKEIAGGGGTSRSPRGATPHTHWALGPVGLPTASLRAVADASPINGVRDKVGSFVHPWSESTGRFFASVVSCFSIDFEGCYARHDILTSVNCSSACSFHRP